MTCNNLAIALVHYPVYNKHHEVVTSALTNLDQHDIAR
ncbi:MAG: RNA methyltransferase, partial [Desulfuromonadales bacterium]